MRIRTVKPEFFLHDGLFEAEKETCLPLRLAYIGLWCACDREGRFKWEPRRLGVSILPYDSIEFSRVLDALTTRGFLVKYRVGGEWFGFVPSFTTHQLINNKERKSALPDIADAEELTGDETTRAQRVLNACSTPLCNAQGEGKGREYGKEGNMERKEEPPAGAGSLANAQEVSTGSDLDKKTKRPSERGLKFAEWFATLIPETVKKSTTWQTKWAQAFDDMIRLDSRTDAQISAVCKWARGDDFWSTNFMSPSKLREKDRTGVQYFDRFSEAMRQSGNRNQPKTEADRDQERTGLKTTYKMPAL